MSAAQRRILDLQHAMQSGVKFDLETDPNREPAEAEKHLRVGVNSAMVEHGALVRLLIGKGVFTLAEYEAELLRGFEWEVAKYEQLLSQRLGQKVTLV